MGLRTLADALVLPLQRPLIMARLATRLFSSMTAEDEERDHVAEAARLLQALASDMSEVCRLETDIQSVDIFESIGRKIYCFYVM